MKRVIVFISVLLFLATSFSLANDANKLRLFGKYINKILSKESLSKTQKVLLLNTDVCPTCVKRNIIECQVLSKQPNLAMIIMGDVKYINIESKYLEPFLIDSENLHSKYIVKGDNNFLIKLSEGKVIEIVTLPKDITEKEFEIIKKSN